jgi:PIN domain nuclease of toxin-antitoxin system
VKLLLDTHAFIWLNDNPLQLSEKIIAVKYRYEEEKPSSNTNNEDSDKPE